MNKDPSRPPPSMHQKPAAARQAFRALLEGARAASNQEAREVQAMSRQLTLRLPMMLMVMQAFHTGGRGRSCDAWLLQRCLCLGSQQVGF